MSAHLGAWLSPLADGQLPPAQAERALAHVAACRTCAAGLEAERAARSALATAAEVTADPDLTDRLMALCATVPPTAGDPLRERRVGPVGAPPGAAFAAPLTGDLAAVARRRRRARGIGVALGGVGLATAALFAAGEAPVVVPDPTPAQALTLLGRTSTSVNAAGDEVLPAVARGAGRAPDAALGWVAEHGWAGPAALPDGLQVSTLRLVGEDAQVLELDLAGSSGHVVVREQRGRLATVPDAAHDVLGGRTVTVLSTEPWHVAWQAGDVVVDVAADVPRDVLAEVLAAFPADGFDSGVLPRLARGWTTVRSAVVSTPP